MQVPILTERQFQILELIAVGATRNEIAVELGISPETVKVHTKAILDKFDATSVRDAMGDINTYLAAYGRDGAGYTSYFHSICGTINVSSDHKSSFITWTTAETIVRGPVTEISSLLQEKGTISDISLNGVKPALEHTDVTSTVVRLKLDKPLSTGDTFQRELTYRAEFFGAQQIENYSISIMSLVKTVSLTARFDGGLPHHWDVVLQKGFIITDIVGHPETKIEHGKDFIKVELCDLSPGETCLIRWSV